MTGRFPNGPPYTTEFPYKNLFTESKSDSWAYRYMRWLTDSMIKAFSENRYLLDMFFVFFLLFLLEYNLRIFLDNNLPS